MTLDGKIRLATGIFLGGCALRTWIGYRQELTELEEAGDHDDDPSEPQ